MSILSNLFGGSDSESANSNSSDLLSILDVGGSIDASNESYDHSVDDDGSEHTSHDAQSFSGDLDIGSLFSNLTDSFLSSDQDSGGGLFG